MAPGVAGSIPVSHPRSTNSESRTAPSCPQFAGTGTRSVAQLVEHRSPKPAVGGSIPSGPVVENCGWKLRSLGQSRVVAALSSRGLGRGPLKAQTRVRIPLALCSSFARIDWPHRLSVRTALFQGAERGSTPLGAMRGAGRAGKSWRGTLGL